MKEASISVQPSAEAPVSFKCYRFPPDIISYAVWLYYRFPSMGCRYNQSERRKREGRDQTFVAWKRAPCARMTV